MNALPPVKNMCGETKAGKKNASTKQDIISAQPRTFNTHTFFRIEDYCMVAQCMGFCGNQVTSDDLTTSNRQLNFPNSAHY